MIRSRSMLRGSNPVNLRQRVRFAQRRRERWLIVGPGVDERIELRSSSIVFVERTITGHAPLSVYRA